LSCLNAIGISLCEYEVAPWKLRTCTKRGSCIAENDGDFLGERAASSPHNFGGGSKCFGNCFDMAIFSCRKTAEMAMMLLQLSLYAVIVIQLTSSQSTYDVVQKEDDVSSCGQTETLLTAVSQLSQLQTAVSQLRRDVAEVKDAVLQTMETGKMGNQKGIRAYKKQLKKFSSLK